MKKQMITKSQLREAINELGPLAPDWLVEALEDFIELQEAHKNLLAMHAEDAYHLEEARAKLYAAPQVSPKVAPTVAIDERAEFEKWAYEQKFTLLRDENSGEYLFAHAELAWESWQAARKLPAPVLADETKKLYEELIYSVASKFPDETRHQTALRYIRNAEKGTSEKADQTRLQFSMLKSSPVSYSANASDAPQVSPVVPKVAPTVAIDERAEFEKWFNTQDYSADVRTWAWNGFRAARKLSAPEVVSKTTDTVVPDDCATPIPHDELCAKLTQHDEPVGVARTNAMLKQGDTFCVFELGSVPEGTKLYTRPQPAKVTQETAVVPDAKDEIDHEGIWTNSDVAEQRYIQGWNDCRAAMLKGEK